MNTGPATESFWPRVARIVAVVEDGILVILVLGMIVIANLQIILRNIFDLGLVWADSLLRAAVLWVGLLGAMVASRSEHHIKIDVLSRFLPPMARELAHLLTQTFAVAVSAVIAFYSFRFVQMDREAGTIAFTILPAWLVESVLPIGFAAIALRYLFAMGRSLRRLRGAAS